MRLHPHDVFLFAKAEGAKLSACDLSQLAHHEGLIA